MSFFRYNFSVLLFLFTFSASAQTLSSYGDIIINTAHQKHEIQSQNHQDFISYNNLQLKGNGFYNFKSILATIQVTCGNTPAKLRLFDLNGTLIKEETFSQIINLQSSTNGEYVYFLNKGNSTILNTATFKEKTISSSLITVNNLGQVTFYDESSNTVNHHGKSISVEERPKDIKTDTDGNTYIFSKNTYQIISLNNIVSQQHYSKGQFFKSKVINNQVYWVERTKNEKVMEYYLFNSKTKASSIDHKTFNYSSKREIVPSNISSKKRTPKSIFYPLNPSGTNIYFPVGNSYGEHQNYGKTKADAYLHPGIDLLGSPGQAVYAVHSGEVKSILTTSASLHWRMAIGNSSSLQEQEGYLYAHLDPATIPFTVGDSITIGDYIGNLIKWPIYNFTHLHFARIKDSGDVWNGSWWTLDNILKDITNFADTSAPVFDTFSYGETIGFQDENEVILNPDSLYGKFDIICRAHDLINSKWKTDADQFRFEIWENLTDPSPVYSQHSFNYDFFIDGYSSKVVSRQILNTIYCINQPWNTLGNYKYRKFYQRVSRSNGDDIIDVNDETVFFDSHIIPNGNYTIRIYATDAKGNENHTDVTVTIDNHNTGITANNNINQLKVAPNPSNGNATIYSEIDMASYDLYDLLGKKVASREFYTPTKLHQLNIAKSGTYILNIRTTNNITNIKKIVVVN
ncbi:T9SS type A sorting domain-containing protein [bacterium]|nr:T9SS type A sorting domain-containing protein [bacterium]